MSQQNSFLTFQDIKNVVGFKNETSFINSVLEKARPKSFHEKNKDTKSLVLLLSYFFNLASAATACFAVFYLCRLFLGPSMAGIAAASTLAVFALVLLEKTK